MLSLPNLISTKSLGSRNIKRCNETITALFNCFIFVCRQQRPTTWSCSEQETAVPRAHSAFRAGSRELNKKFTTFYSRFTRKSFQHGNRMLLTNYRIQQWYTAFEEMKGLQAASSQISITYLPSSVIDVKHYISFEGTTRSSFQLKMNAMKFKTSTILFFISWVVVTKQCYR